MGWGLWDFVDLFHHKVLDMFSLRPTIRWPVVVEDLQYGRIAEFANGPHVNVLDLAHWSE